jgi:hypothetical protein
VHGGLLVAYQDVLEFVLLEDGVVDVQYGAAWITENVFNAFFRQTTDEYFGPRDGGRCFVVHDTFLSRPIGR